MECSKRQNFEICKEKQWVEMTCIVGKNLEI